jgi:hypothetical protein
MCSLDLCDGSYHRFALRAAVIAWTKQDGWIAWIDFHRVRRALKDDGMRAARRTESDRNSAIRAPRTSLDPVSR